jgi:hypothetical protein
MTIVHLSLPSQDVKSDRTSQMGADLSLCAITTYFNPMGYESRLRNYHLFRQKLTVPLVTVELGYGGRFDLKPEDADILLQVEGDSILWQKERLMNLALGKVPKYMRFIAWLDSDVVFDRQDWASRVINRLRNVPLIQTYSQLYRLERNIMPEDVHNQPVHPTRSASVFLIKKKSSLASNLHHATTIKLRQGSVGFGWAARRDLLEQHGFYDGMIIGGGDFVMACAAYGRFDEAISETCLNERRAAHYLAWARPFFEQVRGRVDCINGRIFHLWHGDVKDRQYRQRHVEFAKLNFDPFNDITITKQGCWRLKGRNNRLKMHLKAYFISRKEDG